MTGHKILRNSAGRNLPADVAAIVRDVADRYMVSTEEIMGRSQSAPARAARVTCYRQIRQRVRWRGEPVPFARIGRWFCRGKSAVWKALNPQVTPLMWISPNVAEHTYPGHGIMGL